MTTIQNTDDLLAFIVTLSQSGQKNWFGFPQQRVAGIYLAYEIAKCHADSLSPEEVVDYVVRLNNAIFSKILKGSAE
ncbi:MAG: hypothetical protein ACO3QM_05800 [Candidatus Nanopelagicaceae bacterium]